MNRVCLGKIMGAHGVKGLVKILPFGEDASLIGSIKPLYTSGSGEDQIELTLKNSQGQYMLATVKNIIERDGAENMRGTELWIERSALPKIKEKNTYYHADLIGLNILDETGAEIGRLTNVLNYGSADLFDIRLNAGGAVMIPFTERYVTNIDINKGVSVRNVEDFMDLK